MQLPQPRILLIFALALLFTATTACNNNRDNPDEIRRRTAEATETMRRDTKAVVEGVKDGMGRDKTVNINKAPREELLTLPGITEQKADRIIAERPFDNTHDLVRRRVLSESEYARIQDRVIADR
jgi:DNA uptake protein ComE-like DNA-binding protein